MQLRRICIKKNEKSCEPGMILRWAYMRRGPTRNFKSRVFRQNLTQFCCETKDIAFGFRLRTHCIIFNILVYS